MWTCCLSLTSSVDFFISLWHRETLSQPPICSEIYLSIYLSVNTQVARSPLCRQMYQMRFWWWWKDNCSVSRRTQQLNQERRGFEKIGWCNASSSINLLVRSLLSIQRWGLEKCSHKPSFSVRNCLLSIGNNNLTINPRNTQRPSYQQHWAGEVHKALSGGFWSELIYFWANRA